MCPTVPMCLIHYNLIAKHISTTCSAELRNSCSRGYGIITLVFRRKTKTIPFYVPYCAYVFKYLAFVKHIGTIEHIAVLEDTE